MYYPGKKIKEMALIYVWKFNPEIYIPIKKFP